VIRSAWRCKIFHVPSSGRKIIVKKRVTFRDGGMVGALAIGVRRQHVTVAAGGEDGFAGRILACRLRSVWV